MNPEEAKRQVRQACDRLESDKSKAVYDFLSPQLPLQTPPIDPQHLGAAGDISGILSQYAIDILGFNFSEGGKWRIELRCLFLGKEGREDLLR